MNNTRHISILRSLALVASGAFVSFAHPAAAATHRNAVQLDVGYAHSCAVTSCGEVKCWGRNDWGQSIDMYPATQYSFFRQAPFKEVSVGQFHTCAVDEDQDVVCWGKNNYGQVQEPTGNFTAVDSGYSHSCALDTSGAAVCWGADDQRQSSPPAGSFKKISAGRTHTCAVTTNGQDVVCWGSNRHGQGRSISSFDLGTGEFFKDVSAGDSHTCALTVGNRVYCWGDDYYDQVSNAGYAFDQGQEIYRHPYNAWVDVSAGAYGTLGIVQDGRSAADNEARGWGWPFSSASYRPPANAPSAPIAVAAGYSHGCSIDQAGDVTCFGNNAYGKATPDSTNGYCGLPQLELPIEFQPISLDPR